MGFILFMSRFGPEEETMVLDVLRSGEISPYFRNPAGGKYVQQLEAEFAEYIGVDYAIAVSNGTTALHTAYLACGVKQYNHAVVPAHSFIATASMALAAGAEPHFTDVDINTYCMSEETLTEYFNAGYGKVRGKGGQGDVVVPVDLLGYPVDMKPIYEVAKDRKMMVIEDAAQALGSARNGRRAGGAFNDCACFSWRTTIATPSGPRRISELVKGDEVITADGVGKVTAVHRRRYEGEWVKLRYGKLDSSQFVSMTEEHPVKVKRETEGWARWMPANQIVEHDKVYVPTTKCAICGNPIPFYRKHCNICHSTQSPKAREYYRSQRLLPDNSPALLEPESTNKHWLEDIQPVAQRLENEGYRVIPTSIKPIPDLIAIRNGKVFAVEVESRVSPPLKKIGYYVKGGRYDDIIWVTRRPKTFVEIYGHADYEIEGNFAVVPVLGITHYRHKNPSIVYNLTVEPGNTYIARGLLVHNCWSGQFTKSWTAGEGGMVTTNDREIAERCRSIRSHGSGYLNSPYLTFNFRMTELHAAVGLAQLRKYPKILEQHRRNARHILERLPRGLEPPVVPSDIYHNMYILGCLAHDSFGRERFVEEMTREGVSKGLPGDVVSLGYPEPLYNKPLLSPYAPKERHLPNAEQLCWDWVWLDCHRFKTLDETTGVAEAIRRFR